MRKTSPGYDPFPTVRSPELFISFEVTAKALVKSQVSPSSRTAAKLGSLAAALNGVPELEKKYGTLERCGWPLDGSCFVLADRGAETGYFSEAVSGEDGAFGEAVVVRCEMPHPVTTFGWTFHFDKPGGVWPSRVRASAYDAGGGLVAEAEGIPTGGDGWGLPCFAANYTAVEFAFPGTNLPLRMLRLAEIDFGISKYFDRDSIARARIRCGAAHDGSAFPIRELSFTFENRDRQFNVLSPSGLYEFWRVGQTLSARIRIGEETVDMGVYEITGASLGDSYLTAKVTASCPASRLADRRFDGGADEVVTLAEAVGRVLSRAEIPVDFGGAGGEPVSLAVPRGTSARRALGYLAQAARASVWFDRDGVLRFRRLEPGEREDGILTADALYSWSGISLAKEYGGCVLESENAFRPDEDGHPTLFRYTAGITEDGSRAVLSLSNPCVAPERGEAVAEWLLRAANMKKRYRVENRCDPALEIGDTLLVEDVFGNNDRAVVTGIDITYDGVLRAVTEAVGW